MAPPAGELIITNGDSAGSLLRRAVPGAEVLPWRDVLHEGPVPLTDTLAELTEIRADYLARDGDKRDGVRNILEARDRGLTHSVDFARVTLWFEHDLYDQLQLLQLLDWFSDHLRESGSLVLVQASDFLGNKTPETILDFASLGQPVSEAQLALARKAWRAFRSDTPQAWADLLAGDLSSLPFLEAAVTRMLEELPGTDGLSRTERQMLAALQCGAAAPRELFGAVQREEEAVFMGDWSFFRLLDGLALAEMPLIEGLAEAPFRREDQEHAQAYLRSELALTSFGADALAGRADRAASNKIERWWGGTYLSNDALWRWDAETKRLIAPAR
jgi:hypothetical protein